MKTNKKTRCVFVKKTECIYKKCGKNSKKTRAKTRRKPAKMKKFEKNFIFLIFLLAYIHEKLLQIKMTYIREGIVTTYLSQYLSHTQTKEREMKFNKYAGIGMMCLLVLGDAYAADTVIASKAYVDSKVSSVDVSSTVNTAINGLDVPTVSAPGKPIITVGQDNGKVTATTGTITDAGLADNAVTTAKITDLNVTTGKLAADSVTSAKIKDGEVKTADIANSNVTTDKLADSAVTAAKIAANAVNGDKIAAKVVKYQYHMNNESLFDINTGVVPASGVCVENNPCMLTYYKKDNKVYTRWTPLETDSLSASSTGSDGV